MKITNIFKIIFILLIVCFVFLLVASKSGYYEYELSEKRKLTDEAITRFEDDLKKGKQIDINNYITSTNKNYNNKISNLGNDFSNGIEKVISKGFSYLFDYLNNQIKK